MKSQLTDESALQGAWQAGVPTGMVSQNQATAVLRKGTHPSHAQILSLYSALLFEIGISRLAEGLLLQQAFPDCSDHVLLFIDWTFSTPEATTL